MSNTVKLNTCPKCGAPIPAEAPQGLCPKCVLLGAATATDAGVPATATSEIPSLERIATAFPQLEVLELIGRGGMGFVFKARQPHLDRFVALKLLPDKLAKDAQFAERFNREGRVLAKLNHPSIVTVFDFGQTGGFYYLLMEYVDGVNLRQAMQAGRFSPAEALSIVPKVCEALQYAHEQGILHRDIKPENILLDAKGRVKIADFGIAKLVGEDQPSVTLTNTGAALGTLHYMAPEQLEKPSTVDHRADIYSLGVVFYELLTGELPIGRFAAPSTKTPVGANVDEVVFRTLEKERELRYQSAGEMQTQVEHLTKAGATSAAPASARFGSHGTTAVAPSAPRWLKPVAILFLALGATALPPTLMSAGTSRFTLSLFLLLALTGVALLTRNRLCRRAALVVNAIGLLLPWLSALNVAVAMQNGALALDWRPDFYGIPDSAGFAVLFAFLETSAFAAGLWVLLRRDVKPLFEAAPSAEEGPHGTLVVPDDSAIKRPAQALLAVGIFNWVGSIMAMMVLTYAGLGRQFPLSPQELGVIALLMILFSSVILLAALRMMKLQSYPLAVLGSVLAMITTPGNIFGLPVGLWALVTLRQPKVRAAFNQQRSAAFRAGDLSHGGSAAILAGILVCGIGLIIPQLSKKNPGTTPSLSTAQDSLANPRRTALEAPPMIQFTFTAVEVREEGGARWLAMDYVEQIRGKCQRFFRYEANVPGFTAQTRMDAYLSDAKAGFAPVLHQRVSWKLPPSLPQTNAITLRDLVAKEWLRKSVLIEPGDERVLLKVVVPDGGSLVTAIGVRQTAPPENMPLQPSQQVFPDQRPMAQLEFLLKLEQELLVSYTPEHPRVKLIRQQIAETRKELKHLEQTP